MFQLVSPHLASSGPVCDKAVTREGAGEGIVAGGNVMTAGPDDRHSGVLCERPETALQTTVETVSLLKSASALLVSTSSSPRLTPPFRRRLPRFVRAKQSHRPPLALQERDLDLIRITHSYRLITTPQYLLLFSDESRDGIYRRLQKLFHHGYLDRIGNNPNAPLVYALGRKGAEVLDAPVRREVGERYVAHQLMIGDFRVALTRASRERGISLSWRDIGEGSPIKPDGFFGLRFPDLPEGRNRTFFMLEADRSTMTRERFIQKLAAYQAWHAQGGHTKALGIRSFRILTVTKSEERLASLRRVVAEVPALRGGLPIFWFTAETRLTLTRPVSVFLPIWEVPGGKARSLLPEQLLAAHAAGA